MCINKYYNIYYLNLLNNIHTGVICCSLVCSHFCNAFLLLTYNVPTSVVSLEMSRVLFLDILVVLTKKKIIKLMISKTIILETKVFQNISFYYYQ